jgi:Zn-dependent peptidase ImmA (M78 family)/transcriptional regulator with XRE-family HTH domain
MLLKSQVPGTVVDMSDEPVVSKIGPRIAAFRKQRNMTQAELGDLLGFDNTQISKIEKGTRRVEVSELLVAAEALGVSTRELVGAPERDKLALAARVAQDSTVEDLRAIRQRARQIIEVEHVLAEVAGLQPPARDPRSSEIHAEGLRISQGRTTAKQAVQKQGEALANLVRDRFDLGQAPIADLPEFIEASFGVDVALYPFGNRFDSDKPDGLCVHSGDTHIILANTAFVSGHVRFTLAHELAHHLFDDPREIINETAAEMFADAPVEWRANAFAAALLMPANGVRAIHRRVENADQVSSAALRYLVEHFDVSLAAMVYRLNVLGLLGFDEGQRLRSRGLSKLPDILTGASPDRSEELPSPPRPPTRLTSAALAAFAEQRLGLAPLASLLQRDDDDDLYREVLDTLDAGDSGSEVTEVFGF